MAWGANDQNESFEGASGSDTGEDVLLGTDGANILKGHGGDDSLYGRVGNDRLYGGANSDFFDAGNGADRLYGGSGADVFHFDRGEDNDRIYDFQNDADRLEFDGFTSGFDPFDFADQDGAAVVFNLGGGDRVTVENIPIAQFMNGVELVEVRDPRAHASGAGAGSGVPAAFDPTVICGQIGQVQRRGLIQAWVL